MLKLTLLEHRGRYLSKVLEMNSAMQKLEHQYIDANFSHKVGDEYSYQETLGKKVIEQKGVIDKLEVDYANGVRIIVTLRDKETGLVKKFLYL